MTTIEWFGKELESYGDPEFCEIEWEQLDSLIQQSKEMEKQEKLKIQIAENESVLEMLRLHGNDSSIMRVFSRLESLKEQLKEMEL